MGASTCGDRTPPRTFPLASRAYATGDELVVWRYGGCGGRVPLTTHWLSQEMAASSTQWVPPVLIGITQLGRDAPGDLGGNCIPLRFSAAPWPLPVSVGPTIRP